jgi:BirA family biotin operon repressor/biotin-[acetyl-CoA-carboxylase] ligase
MLMPQSMDTGSLAMAEIARIDIARLMASGLAARVEHYEELSSTQDRARQCAGESDCLLPLLVVADRQLAGRGRQGNSWWTGTGSLAFSLLFDPAAFGCPRRPAPRLALAVGVAIVDAIAPRASSQDSGHCVGLHWPNDVYVGNGKLAGVLVEVLSDGRHILGIGLNSNNSAADAPPELGRQLATLRDLTGRLHDPTELLIDLLHCLANRLRQLGADDPALGETFDALCLQHDRPLTLYLGDRTVTGRCAGIAADGALLLDTSEGRQSFYAGTLRAPQERHGGRSLQ